MTDNITLPRATVQQALEAIDLYQRNEHCEDELLIAGHFLRTALEQQQSERWCMKANGCKTECGNCPNFTQPEQQAEPVAKYSDIVSDGGLDPRNKFDTAPPQRKELSASEILNMMPSTIPAEYDGELMEFARAVEAKTKEGT